MKRNNRPALASAILLSLAFIASGVPFAAQQAAFLSIFAAVILTVATSVVLYLTQLRFGTGAGVLVAPIYTILSSVNPKALILNPLHPASLAVAASLFFCMKFIREDQNIRDAFAGNIFLGIAVCFFPPAIWLFPVALVLCLLKSGDKARFGFASVSGLLLPLAVTSTVSYLLTGIPQAAGFLLNVVTGFVTIAEKSIFYSPATIIRILTVAIFTAAAVVKVRKSFINIVTVALLAIAAIFFKSSGEPFCLWTSMAVTFPLTEFLSDSGTRHRKLYIILILLIVVSERITFYL